MLEKINRMNELYDAYEALLTAKQKLYFELYYQEDLSLAEIAVQFNVSRTAVFDNIKRTQKALENYESKLQLISKREKREALLEKIEQNINEESLKELVWQLQGLE